MNTQLFLQSESSAALVSAPESPEQRRQRREEMEAHRLAVSSGKPTGQQFLDMFHHDRKQADVGIAAPSFDDVPPGSGIGCSIDIPDAEGTVPQPRRQQLRVRYKPTHGPVATRSRLFREPDSTLKDPSHAGGKPSTRRAKGVAGRQKNPGGGLAVFGPCAHSNPIPQIELAPELPAAMLLLKVALSHLRTVGALPYVYDVSYGPLFAKVTLTPQELHSGQFASIPISTVRIFPTIARSRMSNRTRLMRFDALPQAEECDAVFAIAYDSDVVQDNPWEPSFFEHGCRYRFFTGSTAAIGQQERLSSADYAAHRAAMEVTPEILAGGEVPPNSGTGQVAKIARAGSPRRGLVVFSNAIASLQEPFEPFDSCTEDLEMYGFAPRFTWASFASQLHTSIFIAVHRLWYIMEYRQKRNRKSSE